MISAFGSSAPAREPHAHSFLSGLARALGGAVIFALPMLMTMEMWELGAMMPRHRIAILLLAGIPLLVGLSRISGFEATTELIEDVVDAFVAYAVGFVGSAVVLALFGELNTRQSLDAAVGSVALQAVPASIGALLAQSQFGQGRDDDAERERRKSSFWGELFLMAVGSLFLAFNLAPTDEMVQLGYRMGGGAIVALALLSLAAMHGFVYAVDFRGQEQRAEGATQLSAFFRLTVTGYAIALLISAYVLWTFGRFDDTALLPNVMATVVVGFPAAIGAAAARLIL